MNLKNCFFLLIGFLFSASSIAGLHAQSGMSKIAYFDNEKVRRLTALEHYREKSADSPENKNPISKKKQFFRFIISIRRLKKCLLNDTCFTALMATKNTLPLFVVKNDSAVMT